jgi:signal peptidase I
VSKLFLSYLVLCLPLASWSGVRPMIVLGTSMEPTLASGQLVLLHREYYRTHRLERGHVVAFRWQGRVYVKRVHALAGEQVHLVCQTGYCFPTWKEVEARQRRLAQRSPIFHVRSVPVPKGAFFSLGDHYAASIDSRDFGPIPVSAILGRVQSLRSRRSLDSVAHLP